METVALSIIVICLLINAVIDRQTIKKLRAQNGKAE